jgi:hypothetical protein
MAQFAGVGCLSSVYPIGEGWIGKSTDGKTQSFQSLADYKQFLKNLADSGKICPDASVPKAPPPSAMTRTPFAGFLEFLPRNQAEQDLYDPMSPYWQGQEASQTAINQGKYAAENVMVYKKDASKTGSGR